MPTEDNPLKAPAEHIRRVTADEIADACSASINFSDPFDDIRSLANAIVATRDHLMVNGFTNEDAVAIIIELIRKGE
jgi:predicted metal-dependent phosphoesterase TrpH